MRILSGYRNRLRYWIDKKLGHNVFELVDGTIVKDRGRGLDDTIQLSRIRSWQVEYEMIFDIVRLNLLNGQTITWLDYHNDLLGILRENIQHKEQDDTAQHRSRAASAPEGP